MKTGYPRKYPIPNRVDAQEIGVREMQPYHLRRKALTECDVHELLQSSVPSDFGLSCLTELESHVQPIGPQRRGEHLYRASQGAGEIFIVHSGCYKLYAYDRAGREYIHGFRLRGSLMGLHGLYGSTHQFNAIALTDSSVCRLSRHRITELGKQMPDFFNMFLSMVGQELVSNIFLSGNFTAEERVACFLVSFSKKLCSSFDCAETRLPMSRSDIAIYLRLTLPTVSRILSRLKQNGIINSDYHHIQIVDHARMMDICKNVPLSEF